MSTDYEKIRAEEKRLAMEAASLAYDLGYTNGQKDGFQSGLATGFVAGVQSLQGALSSGLRHGSPECGRAMEALKRLGIEQNQGGQE